RRVGARGAILRARLAAAHTAFELERPPEGVEQKQPGFGELDFGRALRRLRDEPIEQALEDRPGFGLRRAYGRRLPRPGERAARGLELAQIPEQSGARAHEHGLAQNEQLTRARLVETNADREEGLERSGEPLSALARAPSERRDATERFGEQREHEIGLAELDAAEHERRALVNRRRSGC